MKIQKKTLNIENDFLYLEMYYEKIFKKKLFLVTSLVSLVAHLPTTILAMDDESDLLLIASSSRPLLKTQPDINTIVSSTAKRVYVKINANWTYIPPG